MVSYINSLDELNKMNISHGGIIPFTLHNDEFFFLFGRETKDSNSDDRSLWGDFGGRVKRDNYLNYIVQSFWEETNGIMGTKEGIRNYIKENFKKLLIVYSKEYNGVIIFLPIDYDKKLERIFYTTTMLYKHVLDSNIKSARERGLLEKDIIKWFSLNELEGPKMKFRKSNKEIVNFIKKNFSL